MARVDSNSAMAMRNMRWQNRNMTASASITMRAMDEATIVSRSVKPCLSVLAVMSVGCPWDVAAEHFVRDDVPSLMEPFLMVFLGAVIGTIVLAMFLPIFNLGSIAH